MPALRTGALCPDLLCRTPPPPHTPPYCSKKRNKEFADKNYGPVLTLLQFLAVAVLSLQYVTQWRGFSRLPAVKALTVPLHVYRDMVLYFVAMSYLNNLAFSFNISQPLHMVFRSSNLVVSYAYGAYLKGKRYTRQQLLAVVLLTLGALCATWAEMRLGETAEAAAKPCLNCGDGMTGAAATAAAAAAAPGAAASSWLSALLNSEAEGGLLYLLRWWMGIAILVIVLLLQTHLGALQEACGVKYGKAPNEMLFYFHAFSLPAFAVCLPELPSTLAKWTASHSVAAELAANWGWSAGALASAGAGPLHALLRLPIMWLYVLLSCVTQFVCLVGVTLLISQVDQLTVNVALTVRKFISLMLSIWVFGNKFTPYHWLGAVLVIGGSSYFSMAPKPEQLAVAAAPSGGELLPPSAAAAAAAALRSGSGADSSLATTPELLSSHRDELAQSKKQ